MFLKMSPSAASPAQPLQPPARLVPSVPAIFLQVGAPCGSSGSCGCSVLSHQTPPFPFQGFPQATPNPRPLLLVCPSLEGLSYTLYFSRPLASKPSTSPPLSRQSSLTAPAFQTHSLHSPFCHFVSSHFTSLILTSTSRLRGWKVGAPPHFSASFCGTCLLDAGHTGVTFPWP